MSCPGWRRGRQFNPNSHGAHISRSSRVAERTYRGAHISLSSWAHISLNSHIVELTYHGVYRISCHSLTYNVVCIAFCSTSSMSSGVGRAPFGNKTTWYDGDWPNIKLKYQGKVKKSYSTIVWYVFLNANKKWNEENRGSEDGCDQTALQLENDMLSKNPRKLFKWNQEEVKGGTTV